MWRKNAAPLPILTLASILITPNCATIIRKQEQRIPVTSSPMGAMVIVNGVEQGATPLELRLGRKTKGQVIRIECPGYNPVEIRLKRSLSPFLVLGNVLLGVAGGAIYGIYRALDDGASDVDYPVYMFICAAFGGYGAVRIDVEGSGYTLRPTNLEVPLTKADGTPRVDTMLVDADDLKNVKWIRVRLTSENR